MTSITVMLRDERGELLDDGSAFVVSLEPQPLAADPLQVTQIDTPSKTVARKYGAFYMVSDAEVLRKLRQLGTHVVGWENVSHDGRVLPFSQNVVMAIMARQPWIRLQVEAALKGLTQNSESSC